VEAETLRKKKKAWDDAITRLAKAKEVIAEVNSKKNIDVYTSPEGARVSDLKTLVQWKSGVMTVPATKQLLINEWNESKNKPPENLPEEWTDGDEQQLTRLATEEITLAETAVSKKAGELVNHVMAGVVHMSAAQIRELKAALPATPESVNFRSKLVLISLSS
jgi:hypothetical protein